jgi:ERCC4-type nuclease
MATAETETKKSAKPPRIPIGERPLEVPFTVLIDSRENAPYGFQGLRADAKDHHRELIIETKWQGLPTGDYSIDGFADCLCVERKSAADLYSTLGSGRARFEREHERMAEMVAAGGYACVVIEASASSLFSRPPPNSRLNPKTVFRTWLAWSRRYHVPWLMVDGRRLGEITTFRTLEGFWKDWKEKEGVSEGANEQ